MSKRAGSTAQQEESMNEAISNQLIGIGFILSVITAALVSIAMTLRDIAASLEKRK